mgnify:FL=1
MQGEGHDSSIRKLHPIAYESRRLTGPETRYATYEKEMLAVVHCIATFRHYLEGATTTVYTDHQSLRHFTTSFHLSRRMTKWMKGVAHFDYEIKYIKGNANNLADGLSLYPKRS